MTHRPRADDSTNAGPYLKFQAVALLCLRSHPASLLRGSVSQVRERGICRVGKLVALASVVADRRFAAAVLVTAAWIGALGYAVVQLLS
jgi:hypothetical protein